jgi:N-acyl amino acid synthase FeeM
VPPTRWSGEHDFFAIHSELKRILGDFPPQPRILGRDMVFSRPGAFDGVDYRLIDEPTEKEKIYRLRYSAYIREDAVLPNVNQWITDEYDDLPNTWIFGVYMGGELVSSIRITVATPDEPSSPSADRFSDLIGPELAEGKTIVDPTMFVADSERANRDPELAYLTLRLSYVACEYFDADLHLATVRSKDLAFYQTVFLQQPMGSSRLFPEFVKPMHLLAADFPAVKQTLLQQYPYFRSSLLEQTILFDRSSLGLAPDLLLSSATNDRPSKIQFVANKLATFLNKTEISDILLELNSTNYDPYERQLLALMMVKLFAQDRKLSVVVNRVEKLLSEAPYGSAFDQARPIILHEIGWLYHHRANQLNTAKSFYLSAAKAAMATNQFRTAKSILERVREID